MYRIMLVEDDRELGETIKSLLTLKGYDVTLIGSVKEYSKHTEVYDMYLLYIKQIHIIHFCMICICLM